MKRIWKILIITGIWSFAVSFAAFAGSWQQDDIGFWYQNDDGSYPANCWQWIDGNADGIAEHYYFDENGYLLTSTVTPDPCTVNADGAWTVDGVVQTQTVILPETVSISPLETPAETQAPQQNSASGSRSRTGVSSSPYDGYTIIVNTNTKKYHVPSCSSVKDMKARNMGYADDADALRAMCQIPTIFPLSCFPLSFSFS